MRFRQQGLRRGCAHKIRRLLPLVGLNHVGCFASEATSVQSILIEQGPKARDVRGGLELAEQTYSVRTFGV